MVITHIHVASEQDSRVISAVIVVISKKNRSTFFLHLGMMFILVIIVLILRLFSPKWGMHSLYIFASINKAEAIPMVPTFTRFYRATPC